MTCHTQCTTRATPLRWKHSLGALLICRSISFCLIWLLYQTPSLSPWKGKGVHRWELKLRLRKNSYPSTKLKQAKKKQESYSERHPLYLLHRQDLGVCFQFPPALHGCIKVSHLGEVAHGTCLCSEGQQQEKVASFPCKIKHSTTALD